MVAPTIDTERNAGVEVRVGAEFDFFVVHVGAGGGGGLAYAQRASAWQVGGGGSIPLDKDTGANWLDLDIHYSGYLLHSVQDVNPDASPYAHGVRLGTTYRRLVAGHGDTHLLIGPGFFGEASFREGQTLGIFGLPLCLQLIAEPKINFSKVFNIR